MSLDSLRILILMANNIGDDARDQDVFNFEDESDDEFGLPELRIHLADSLTPAVLRDWTAADFTSIYVRFRPHIERHAKKFLKNPSQVEEVVQEAFLYLMTTLPELDSELGVLRFLKWKTRLLALDVIRAASKVTLAPIDESPDLASNDPELSHDLERAEDAGIVALALSKIQPRHREAIIATLYEEKSAEVVAAQMGLSENAFRQLLFRARSAFRKSLVGEAETKGKSVSEILSIAARKAAAESGKYISAAGAFLLVLAVSIGVLPNLFAPVQEQVLSEPTASPTQETGITGAPTPEVEITSETIPAELETVAADAPNPPETLVVDLEKVDLLQSPPEISAGPTQAESVFMPRIETTSAQELKTGLRTTSLAIRQVTHPLGTPMDHLAVSFDFGGGIQLFANYNPSNNLLLSPLLVGSVEGQQVFGIPKLAVTESTALGGGHAELRLSVQDFYSEVDGSVLDYSWITNSSSAITVYTNAQMQITSGEALIQG